MDAGKVMYEARIDWVGDSGGLCRFGFGSKAAYICGGSRESFGYCGSGRFVHGDQAEAFWEKFTKGDIITVAVRFKKQRVYFAKNGRKVRVDRTLPKYLRKKRLFPLLALKNSRAEFNFGAPRKPCKWMMSKGFKTLVEIASGDDAEDDDAEDDEDEDGDGEEKRGSDEKEVDWHSEGVVPGLWLEIFVSLSVPEIFRSKFVCKKWHELISRYNVMERNEICCYFNRAKLGGEYGKIMGIGFKLEQKESGYGVEIKSQMDILSASAWENGCRIGVWGEPMTHFLPLVMNKEHARNAHQEIKRYLHVISEEMAELSPRNELWSKTDLEAMLDRHEPLRMVDTLVTMMNAIVVQFVMEHQATVVIEDLNDIDPRSGGLDEEQSGAVSMRMCEKVVLGYSALHHLLLYLQGKHRKLVTNFADRTGGKFKEHMAESGKSVCKDLGKIFVQEETDVNRIFFKNMPFKISILGPKKTDYSKNYAVEDRFQFN